jgi:hypothetical protein
MGSNGRPGLSRRDVIKRGAVAGGIIWAAPVVESFTNAAFATGSPPCTSSACIDVTMGGSSFHHFCSLDQNSVACQCCCVFSAMCNSCTPDPGTDSCNTFHIVPGSCGPFSQGVCQ